MSDSTLPSLGFEAIPDPSSLSTLEFQSFRLCSASFQPGAPASTQSEVLQVLRAPPLHTAPPASASVHVASPHTRRCSPLRAALPHLAEETVAPTPLSPQAGWARAAITSDLLPSLCAALAWLRVKAPRLQISQEHSPGTVPPEQGGHAYSIPGQRPTGKVVNWPRLGPVGMGRCERGR